MPDTAYNRYFVLRADGTQFVVIKTTQVRRRTAASNDGYAIKTRDLFQRGYDGFRGLLPLHSSAKQLGFKMIAAIVQLVLEVLVSCRIRR